MYKILLPFFALLLSCSDQPGSSVNTQTESNNLKERTDTIEMEQNADKDVVLLAKEWLMNAINRQFDEGVHNFEEITTEEYYGLKSDLINSNYSHGIDLDSIQKKWSYKYEITSDDIDVGFLINAQDYGEIQIESCKLIQLITDSRFVFEVSLYDTLFEARYKSDITVIPYKGSFAIDYVREHWK